MTADEEKLAAMAKRLWAELAALKLIAKGICDIDIYNHAQLVCDGISDSILGIENALPKAEQP